MTDSKKEPGLDGFQWDAALATTLDDFDKTIRGHTDEPSKKTKDEGKDDDPPSKDAFFGIDDDDAPFDPPAKAPEKKVEADDEGEEDDDDVPQPPAKPEPVKKTDDEGDDDETVYATLFKDHVEQGLFDVEEGEEIPEKMTPDEYYERLEKKIDQRVEEALQSLFKDELDQDALAFLKFKKNGGNTQDFFKVYGQTKEYSKMDITKEATMKMVIREKLIADGLSEEDAAEEIEILTDAGRLETRAKAYYKQLVEKEQQQKEMLVQRQKQEREKAEQQRAQTYKMLNEVVKKGAAAKIQLSKKDTVIPEYIMAPASKGENVSQFTKDLSAIYSDPEKLVLLAKLVRSGLDMSDIKTHIESDATRKARKSLFTEKETKSTFGGGGKKSIADYL